MSLVSGAIDAHQLQIRDILTQLSQLPPDKVESDHLEVKGWCKNYKELFEKVSESCSCLANGDGGILIVGVSEDAHASERFSACPYRDLNPELLALKLSELTHPPVKCDAYDATTILREVTTCRDASAYALIVPKSTSINGHMTTKGVSKIRVGKECKPNFNAEDDYTRKMIPALSVHDLSTLSVAWAIAAHERAYKVPKNQWSSQAEFLLQAGLIIAHSPGDEDNPRYLVTLAALLLFGNEQSIAKHVGHCETVIKSSAGAKTTRRNIVDSYRELCETKSSLLPSLTPGVSLATLKELVMNSYIHRCYRMASGIVITANSDEFTVQSPGELASTLNASGLIYCVPVYRNLLLAEGARFMGLCDKVGQGIDMVYRAVLFGGFDFPHFESEGGSFLASIPLKGSENFREFALKRSQSLTSLDEIAVLRTLYARERSSFCELSSAMQRGVGPARRVLAEMMSKKMIESTDSDSYSLSAVIRSDIEHIFTCDQLTFGLDLYGES